MEEIKVGEYIRTPWGNIEKVERYFIAESIQDKNTDDLK